MLTLRHQTGVFYACRKSAAGYLKQDESAIRAELYRFLERAQRYKEPRGALLPFQPTKSKVENVLDALRATANLPTTYGMLCWLDGDPRRPDPFDVVACHNGLLHISGRELLTPTPYFFTLNTLDLAYDPQAPEPDQWLRFVGSLWPKDRESRETLGEWFGYLLTPRTHFQKVLMLVGPKRSGKGTVGRVVRRLLGDGNVCGPTLASMGQPFGLATLVGKSAAIIADARIGGRTDTAAITERLLSISGEDTLSVPRKYLPDWTGKLSTRFVMLTNELPRIEDPSRRAGIPLCCADADRVVLRPRGPCAVRPLRPGATGILNWALAGFDRLYARGRFVQPDTTANLTRQFQDLAAPSARSSGTGATSAWDTKSHTRCCSSRGRTGVRKTGATSLALPKPAAKTSAPPCRGSAKPIRASSENACGTTKASASNRRKTDDARYAQVRAPMYCTSTTFAGTRAKTLYAQSTPVCGPSRTGGRPGYPPRTGIRLRKCRSQESAVGGPTGEGRAPILIGYRRPESRWVFLGFSRISREL